MTDATDDSTNGSMTGMLRTRSLSDITLVLAVAVPLLGFAALWWPGGSETWDSGFARLAIGLYAAMAGYLLLVVSLVTRLSGLRRNHGQRHKRERLLLAVTIVAVLVGLGPMIGLAAMMVGS